MDDTQTVQNPFDLPDMSFEEYRNQEVIETNDGAFFDMLDKIAGVVPRTNQLVFEGDAA
jgi:hypothetical protein